MPYTRTDGLKQPGGLFSSYLFKNDAYIQNEQMDQYFIIRAPFLGHDLGIEPVRIDERSSAQS